MISIGGIIGGSTILEVIFRYPGAGELLFTAVYNRDYPLMMGGFMIITFTVVTAIMVADITYKYVDPRAGEAGKTIESYGNIRVRTFLKRKLVALPVGPSAGTAVSGGQHAGGRPGDLPFETEHTVDNAAAGRNVSETLQTLWTIWDDWRLRVGTLGLLVYVLMGTVGVVLTAPTAQYDQERYVTPTLENGLLFGTDKFGQDLLALTIHSTPAMFKMILAGSVFATSVAVLVGIVSGYRGGLTDRVAMTVSDIVLTVPGLPLTLVLVATIEPSNPYFIGIILTTASWAGLARNIRSEVLTIRDYSYVESSRLSGIGTFRVLVRDILPNLAPYILINFVSSARGVIFGSVGLYFLGVLPFTNQNWGIMLNQAYNNGALLDPSRFYWIFVPIVTITGLSVSLVLMAQGLDRLFNPRIRAGEEDENGA
jgi:ABC-type dipeptide/oligopeptide/nickel transport system permease subunit